MSGESYYVHNRYVGLLMIGLCVCPQLLWIQLVGVLGNGYSYDYWLDLGRLIGDWLYYIQKRKKGKEAT